MANWYQPENIHFLREAGINLIWVIFSNGFSMETERPQQERLRTYIDECHRQGIHVMAYESIANMFWEDMYEHVPESRNWIAIGKDNKPVPYGAADYTKEGRVTRYMADLSKPEWRAYLRTRIDLALDAGADGIIYDNNFSDYLLDTYHEMYQYALSRKRDFVLMGNFHENTFVLNRLTNALTTEDGSEPGVYVESHVRDSESHVHDSNVAGDRNDLLAVDGGLLVNNIGLLRIHRALTDGWKPAMVEDSRREVGERFRTVMSTARHKLALAEAMMFGISTEPFLEDEFAQRLKTGDPETLRTWDAIGQYNRFFADNEELYTNTKSLARLAIVLDDRRPDVGLLNGLAARNVAYDVIYERDITSEKLAAYSAIALLKVDSVRATAMSAIKTFVARGGKLLIAGSAASLDETGARRQEPVSGWCKTQQRGCVYYEKLPPLEELASALSRSGSPSMVQVAAPKGVLSNALTQSTASGQSRVLIHLLNYTAQPVHDTKITVNGTFQNVTLLSPDSPRAPVQMLTSPANVTTINVPELQTYTVLALTPK
jgi:hypothetical protein